MYLLDVCYNSKTYICLLVTYLKFYMSTITSNMNLIIIGLPIFFAIIGITFRLLDNSASIFLNHEILVDSSNVSQKLIKEQIESTDNQNLRKSLKKALLYRRLHNLFMLLSLVALIPAIITFITSPPLLAS